MTRRAIISTLLAPLLGRAREPELEVTVRRLKDGRYGVYHATPDRTIAWYLCGTLEQAVRVLRHVLTRDKA